MDNRKYRFSWSLLGDIKSGRPNLGQNTRVETYRLMQFTFRDVVEQHYGSEAADMIFFEAGLLAGKAFYTEVIGSPTDFSEFCRAFQAALTTMGIGVIRFEKTDLENGVITLTVSEDLDCSGLPETDSEVCTYDEGFISGVLQSYFGEEYSVKEIDCWCTGERTCRFRAVANRK
jgi:predicted hydrocarbon binding protein